MKLTRRQFVKSLGAAGATAAAPLSFSTKASQVDDYKALICIFFDGGNDFFHQVVPMDSEYYGHYAAVRQGIAVKKSQLMPLTLRDQNGIPLGLHKSLAPIKPLFDRGMANVALNVGPLLAPTTKDDIVARRAELPPYLFAHNKQQEVWQHSWMGDEYSEQGWLGMTMDVLMKQFSALPNSFYTGPNTLLDSYDTDKVFVNKNGFEELKALTGAAIRSSYETLANQPYDSPLMAGYAEVVQEAISAQQQMEPICTSIPQDKRIPSSDLGSQLRAIKQMIDGAQELGHNRQVFYVGIGGYDTHDNQVRRQDALMKDFAEAIAGLYKALEEDGLGDQVLTFTMSEFGRTMHDNARKGTDHGWGGGQYIFGSQIAQGECFGAFPDFKRNGKDDNGDGRLIPTISHEQYAAHMVQWFGLRPAGVHTVFPSLAKFGGPMTRSA